uniref:Uncharacterized protein n=1 Tax=Arundo donax TaxID=35708 RepID=A0A0A8YK50_ARUDO
MACVTGQHAAAMKPPLSSRITVLVPPFPVSS